MNFEVKGTFQRATKNRKPMVYGAVVMDWSL